MSDPPPAPARTAPAGDAAATVERLRERRLLVVTGKGGVGKTVLAAVLGRRTAAPGRRVLVLEIDPRENLHHMLGRSPSGGEVTAAGDGLWLQNLKPRQVVDRLVAERLRLEVVARRVLASPVYQQFTEGAPGLKEVAILGHALRLVEGEDPEGGEPFDSVVLDAPATGHGVSLLTAPRLLSEVIRQGPIGEMAARLAGFVADPAQVGVVIVTSPEEMPVQEALELCRRLEAELGRGPELVVVNGVYPPYPEDAGAPSDEALALWRDRRRYQESEMARLAAAWRGPTVRLPKLPLDRGPELVAALAAALVPGEAAWS